MLNASACFGSINLKLAVGGENAPNADFSLFTRGQIYIIEPHIIGQGFLLKSQKSHVGIAATFDAKHFAVGALLQKPFDKTVTVQSYRFEELTHTEFFAELHAGNLHLSNYYTLTLLRSDEFTNSQHEADERIGAYYDFAMGDFKISPAIYFTAGLNETSQDHGKAALRAEYNLAGGKISGECASLFVDTLQIATFYARARKIFVLGKSFVPIKIFAGGSKNITLKAEGGYGMFFGADGNDKISCGAIERNVLGENSVALYVDCVYNWKDLEANARYELSSHADRAAVEIATTLSRKLRLLCSYEYFSQTHRFSAGIAY